MPVRVLYEMKEAALPLVVDMYKEIIIPSLEDDFKQSSYLDMISPLKYDIEATDTEEKSIFDDWKNVKNQLYFTKGYTEIFGDNPIAGLWVAYEALRRVFEKYPGPNFYASYMQVFYYNKKKFWVTAQANHVVFTTPAEY